MATGRPPRTARSTRAGEPGSRLPDVSTAHCDIPGGVTLGVGPSRYPATDIGLPPGSVLALYTCSAL
jgi:hypothetical protein